MSARYVIVDVFTTEVLSGNALAVFPDPRSVDPSLMQKIAREMNLSETTFVTAIRDDGYDVRIFTPGNEMPFAGHPTLGTAWVVREHLGLIATDAFTQRSPAGDTPVRSTKDRMSFERSGTVSDEVDATDIARALEIDPAAIGFDARAVGSGDAVLRPAVVDVGFPQLIVPIADPSVLAALEAPRHIPGETDGVYCVAPLGEGRIKARFFATDLGVMEDPATGSAAASLGVFIGTRAGSCSFEITQGAEIARPSTLYVEAEPGRARVGGSVRLPSAFITST
jgi:trans-2,3-dihydro-3-hydroxyanthranilate isomerase